jgi:hypothetical protein
VLRTRTTKTGTWTGRPQQHPQLVRISFVRRRPHSGVYPKRMNVGTGWDETRAQTTRIVVWVPGKFLLCSFLIFFIQLTSTFLSTGVISQRHDDTRQRTRASTSQRSTAQPRWAAYKCCEYLLASGNVGRSQGGRRERRSVQWGAYKVQRSTHEVCDYHNPPTSQPHCPHSLLALWQPMMTDDAPSPTPASNCSRGAYGHLTTTMHQTADGTPFTAVSDCSWGMGCERICRTQQPQQQQALRMSGMDDSDAEQHGTHPTPTSSCS